MLYTGVQGILVSVYFSQKEICVSNIKATFSEKKSIFCKTDPKEEKGQYSKGSILFFKFMPHSTILKDIEM